MARGRPDIAAEALRAHLRAESRSAVDLRVDRAWLEREVSPFPDQLLADLQRRGLAHRLQRGRYVVNTFDRTSSDAPLLDALEPLADTLLARIRVPYYLSWHTALYHYGLIEQQATTVFCGVTVRKRNADFFGFGVRFVTLDRSRFFGIEPVDGYKTPVQMATVERALLDALERPELTAPFPVIVAAFSDAVASGMLSPARLVLYTIAMGSPALVRRVGFLMERYGVEGADQLREHIGTTRYAVPLRTGGSRNDGELDKRWKLRVPPSLLQSAERLK